METEGRKKKHAHVNPFDINNLMASSAFGANALGFPPFMPFHSMLPMLPTSMSTLHSSEQLNISSNNGSENEKSPANESVEWWKSYQDKSQNEIADHIFPNPFLNSMFPPLWNPPQVPSFISKPESSTPSRPSSRPVSASTTNSKQPSPSNKLSRTYTHHNGSRTRTDSESSSILSPHAIRPPSSNAMPIKRPDAASPASTFTAASFSSPTNIDNTSRDDIFSPSMNPFLFPFGAMSAYSAFGGIPMPFPASSMINGGLTPFMLPMMPDFSSTNLLESNESKRSPSVRDSPFSHKSHNSRKSEQNYDYLLNKTPVNELRESDFEKQNTLFDSLTPSNLGNRTKDVAKNKKMDKILFKDTFSSTFDQEKEISNNKSKPKTNKNSSLSNVNAKNIYNNGNMSTSREASEALSISKDGAIDLSMKKPHIASTRPNKQSRSQRQSKIADSNPADFLAALAHSHQAQMLASAAFPDPFNFPSLLPQLYDNMAGMFYPQNALAAIAAAAAGSSANERKGRRGRRGKVVDSSKGNNKGGKSTLFISSMMAQMEGCEDGAQPLRGNEVKDTKKRQRGKGRLFHVPEMTFHDIEKLQEMTKQDKQYSKGITSTSSNKKEPSLQTPFKKSYRPLEEENLQSSSQSLLPYHSFNEDEACSNTDSPDPINGLHCTGSQSEKRKSSIDSNVVINNKRKRIVHTNKQLELPLNLGWKRETKIEYITQDKVFGTVSYITPCGKSLTTLEEIKHYIECSSNALTVNNFSFNKGRKLGKFFQCIKDRDDVSSYKEMSEEHVDALVSAIDIQRQFLLLQRINRNNKSTTSTELSNHSKESQNKQTKEIGKINQINKGEEAKRLRDEKKSQKLADRLNRQQLSRIERDVKLIQIQEERDAKKQQINYAKEQEKERRKNYILLTKVVEARKREEEKERLKEEKKQARKVDRDKKIEQKRLEFFMAKELQKPNDDMLLNDSQILPDLERILGLRLPGKAFANCLTILEFVHNFASTLKIENDLLPTLSLLQGGLLNDDAVYNSFINFVKKILKIAFEDPGFSHPRDGILQYGQKILDVEINKDNISEIMRLFIKSRNGPNDEMVEWLKGCPFEALNATDKSSILVFFCNEILTSKQIIVDIEKNIEVINNQRKDKWIVDGKLRKLRQQLVNRHRNNNTNRALIKEDVSTPLTTSFYSKKDSEDEQSDADSNEDVEHPESDVEDDKTISTEELETKKKKVPTATLR